VGSEARVTSVLLIGASVTTGVALVTVEVDGATVGGAGAGLLNGARTFASDRRIGLTDCRSTVVRNRSIRHGAGSRSRRRRRVRRTAVRDRHALLVDLPVGLVQRQPVEREKALVLARRVVCRNLGRVSRELGGAVVVVEHAHIVDPRLARTRVRRDETFLVLVVLPRYLHVTRHVHGGRRLERLSEVRCDRVHHLAQRLVARGVPVVGERLGVVSRTAIVLASVETRVDAGGRQGVVRGVDRVGLVRSFGLGDVAVAVRGSNERRESEDT
jgi:hypothetical protein